MFTVAFGVSIMSRTQIQLWYNGFREGREDVYDNARTSRLSTSTTDENIEAVKKMILDNRRITIREVADNVGISFGSCQVILMDVLGMKRAAAKQTQRRMEITQEMLTTFNDNPDLLRLRRFGVETKVQSSQWKRPEEPGPKKNTSSSIRCEYFCDCLLRSQWGTAS